MAHEPRAGAAATYTMRRNAAYELAGGYPRQAGKSADGWRLQMARITVDRDTIAAFCSRHHIRRLAFFGSVLRDDFRPDSDVDMLVEFEPGRVAGFFQMAAMEEESSVLLGNRGVDLRTPRELSRSFRDEVVASAEVQYAGG